MQNNYPLLDGIASPEDLRAMELSEIPALAEEIRAFLIEHVSRTGGHLASNLGVVELSIALHRVFDAPTDHILWDVGHQSYVHKLLTGRRAAFDTLRTPGGLSGFTRREESVYDPFGAGHSSTSVSAALGFAEADRIAGTRAFTVAVLGDGAFTGGMVHEALNNCKPDLPLILILNENEMSISKNIGGFAEYMAKIRASRSYVRAKRHTASLLKKLPLVGNGIFRMLREMKQNMKNSLYGSNYFEELGLFYMGPADGNDYEATEKLLRDAKEKGESVIVHLKTKKGKGYPPAEEKPADYHSVYPTAREGALTFSRVMGETLAELAAEDGDVVAVTAAMAEGTGLSRFAVRHPDRFFDVGIAEAHALTFSAGLCAEGRKPFCALYSTFLQRGYDNLLHDIALQKLPVCICVDRAGLAKGDGATHHGIFDVAFASHIPHVEIYAPASFGSLQAMLRDALTAELPRLIRYPSGAPAEDVLARFYPEGDNGNYGIRADFAPDAERDCILLTYGPIVSEALTAQAMLAARGIRMGILLLEQLKPYDRLADALLPFLQGRACPLLFLEEGVRFGGAGMLLEDTLRRRYPEIPAACTYGILAIDDHFAIPAKGEEYLTHCHISAADAVQYMEAALRAPRA